jgi:hypothetical protein
MASTVPIAGSAYTYAYATMGEFSIMVRIRMDLPHTDPMQWGGKLW